MFLIAKVCFITISLMNCSSPSNKVDYLEQEDGKEEKTLVEFGQKPDVYNYTFNGIEQKLKITSKSENEIYFEYTIRNTAENCEITLKGNAVNKNPEMDPELDEDEEGVAYPSIQYIYENGDCYLGIRIAMIDRDKVVVLSECKEKEIDGCLIGSLGILKKL